MLCAYLNKECCYYSKKSRIVSSLVKKNNKLLKKKKSIANTRKSLESNLVFLEWLLVLESLLSMSSGARLSDIIGVIIWIMSSELFDPVYYLLDKCHEVTCHSDFWASRSSGKTRGPWVFCFLWQNSQLKLYKRFWIAPTGGETM